MLWIGDARAFARGLCLVLGLFIVPGCSQEPLPKTYTVKGKVVYKDGKPFPGGQITFMSVANPEQRGYGKIAKDGTFTLGTINRSSKGRSTLLQGAVEGEFRVNIRPDAGNGGGAAGPPVFAGKAAYTLSKTYKIEAKDDAELTVVVE